MIAPFLRLLLTINRNDSAIFFEYLTPDCDYGPTAAIRSKKLQYHAHPSPRKKKVTKKKKIKKKKQKNLLILKKNFLKKKKIKKKGREEKRKK